MIHTNLNSPVFFLGQFYFKRCISLRSMSGKKSFWDYFDNSRKVENATISGRAKSWISGDFWIMAFLSLNILVTRIGQSCSLSSSLLNETFSNANPQAILEKISKYWVHPFLLIFKGQNWPFKLDFAAIFQRLNQMTWYFGFNNG